MAEPLTPTLRPGHRLLTSSTAPGAQGERGEQASGPLPAQRRAVGSSGPPAWRNASPASVPISSGVCRQSAANPLAGTVVKAGRFSNPVEPRRVRLAARCPVCPGRFAASVDGTDARPCK
jgi:hypothetical protein